MHVHAQNAGLVVRKTDNVIVFETLELLPPNETVMNTKGRVKRAFPGPAVAVSATTFNDTGFQEMLAETLATMSVQVVDEMLAKAKKAGQKQNETRDTTNPAMLTEFLATLLQAMGNAVAVPRLWKHTREEVMWSGGLRPWQRSPVWLLARVAMQTTFAATSASKRGTGADLYKDFMAFFMAELLGAACGQDLERDLLHCMLSKVARRLLKIERRLGTPLSIETQPWMPVVDGYLAAANRLIDASWERVIQDSDPNLPLDQLKTLDIAEDTKTQLPQLNAYIDRINNPRARTPTSPFRPSSIVDSLLPGTLPSTAYFSKGSCDNKDAKLYRLANFEAWVFLHLDDWLTSHLAEEATCSQLKQLLEYYHMAAADAYKENPENVSMLVLTCMELWVACDRSATSTHPLLRDYAPEVPVQALQSLLLPRKPDMVRLARIESYAAGREANAIASRPSVFRDFGAQASFAVQYVGTSKRHRDLVEQIEQHARTKREAKKRELAEDKQEYASLMRTYHEKSCDYEKYYDKDDEITRTRHSSNCVRCACENRAKGMSIAVYEWPLPQDRCHAQAVVFEIDIPAAFANWRDATAFVVLDVLKAQYSDMRKPAFRYTPNSCLSRFEKSSSTAQRIHPLSEAKPSVVTHRSTVVVSTASEASVCVRNGLVYQYFDKENGVLVRPWVTTEVIPNQCMYQLPAESKDALQKFLYRPFSLPNGLAPNAVVAQQGACPAQMTLAEFKALASLPYGTRTQWSNLLVQLAMPVVDFDKNETFLTLLQMLRQAGPPRPGGNVAREAHSDPCSDDFGQRLAHQLAVAVARFQENWASYRALGGFIAITTRLLSLTQHTPVRDACLGVLSTCRTTALDWARRLQDKARETLDPVQRSEWMTLVFDISQIATSTVDVDTADLIQILQDDNSVADFVEACILVEETSHSALASQSQKDSRGAVAVRALCNQRWLRLTLRASAVLQKAIIEGQRTGLDTAIAKTWTDYRPLESWHIVAGHWLMTTSGQRTVHLDLLTGVLLVDGDRLSRLPSYFEADETYRLVFGRMIVEVMPTQRPGMQFVARAPFRGHTVYFGTYADSEVAVSCVQDAETTDLLPRRLLRDRVPEHFLLGYVHWYRRSTRTVEFRPVAEPWTSLPSHWLLGRVPGGGGWQMHRGKNEAMVIDRDADTSTLLSGIFAGVEATPHLHLTWKAAEGKLQIQLPRLQLAFDLAAGSSAVVSREYRGMQLATSPVVGTLIGLTSKLVLENGKSDQRRLLMLVPNGKVMWTRNNKNNSQTHVHVQIQKDTSTSVHPYILDTHLGRILDNGSIQSKLHRCFLHALTSYCRPDPLTAATGTEQALVILAGADVLSALRLTRDNIAILERIASLVPKRTFYPKGMQQMQTVIWDKQLSFLSQQGALCTATRALLRHAAEREFFHYSKCAALVEYLDELDSSTKFLLERDAIRSAPLRRTAYGAEAHTTQHDTKYNGRHQFSNQSGRLKDVFCTVKHVFEMKTTLQELLQSGLRDKLWHLLHENGPVSGKTSPLQTHVGYDAQRLDDWKSVVATEFCPLHRELGQALPTLNRFQVIAFLSTMAFSKEASMQVIQTLVAMYTVRAVALVTTPKAGTFSLKFGGALKHSAINDVVTSHAKAYGQSSEQHLPKLQGETKNQAKDRRWKVFEQRKRRAIDCLTGDIVKQWPCERPIVPEDTSAYDEYVNIVSAMDATRSLFLHWWNNRHFYEYLTRLENGMCRLPFTTMSGPKSIMATPIAHSSLPLAFVSELNLFSGSPPTIPEAELWYPEALSPKAQTETAAVVDPKLTTLVDRLGSAASARHARHEEAYVEDLRKSVASLLTDTTGVAYRKPSRNVLQNLLDRSKKYLHHVYKALVAATIGTQPAYVRYLCPAATPAFFMRQLSFSHVKNLTPSWKDAIVAYALAISDVQRAQRLLRACGGSPADLTRELANAGPRTWDPFAAPEWLLIEVESGIRIRSVQSAIAKHMMAPPEDANATMQLNMGEGKSSVIVPIVAAALADGTRLVRIVVGKPQSKQMLQMLVQKLGGLCGRPVYHMPVARSLALTKDNVVMLKRFCEECMARGGVLLVQPEHLLSFQLLGIEMAQTGRPGPAQAVLDTLCSFNAHARDIVDESDENFSVRFELVYTMGAQCPVELSRDRWVLVQAVLDLVASIAREVKTEFPRSVELSAGVAGSFPRLRLVAADARAWVCLKVATRICTEGLPGLPIGRQSLTMRTAVFKYITEAHPSSDTVETVESSVTFWTESIRPRLYLVRGLLCSPGGVFAFALGSKRWRVNYGCDLSRRPPTRLAVPFRAKDQPAPRAEFSHPDVVLVLTCLSYYYSGLSDDELFSTFAHLFLSDQATVIYGDMMRSVTGLPATFRGLGGVNLQDHDQCTRRLFPRIRCTKAVVDYYLANLVFPKEMRAFPHKLSASGWDLGKTTGTHPTTGFSGTNDAQHLLPLGVQHLDLPAQCHTNALVLQYLLRPENGVVSMPEEPIEAGAAEDETSDAGRLLRLIMNAPEVSDVILDAGAQILELVNVDVAKTWLAMHPDDGDKQAVVFVDDDDELRIIDRTGYVESFQTSPYAQQLDQCLIFLDEAHTRGIDLQLPDHYRAAVTLGANLTKDRLVQGT